MKKNQVFLLKRLLIFRIKHEEREVIGMKRERFYTPPCIRLRLFSVSFCWIGVTSVSYLILIIKVIFVGWIQNCFDN